MDRRSRLRQFVVLAGVVAAVVVGLARGAAWAPIPPLNQKVLEFTRERIGKKVDDGQCISLAVEALRFAGAKRYPFDPSGDYVWGRPIASFKEALPGDILQFRNAVFQGKRWITKRRWVSWHYEYPHHTAIVSDVREGGRVVAMLHQNVGAHDDDDATKQVVQEASIRPESLQPGGSVAIFRPVARDKGEIREGWGKGQASLRRMSDELLWSLVVVSRLGFRGRSRDIDLIRSVRRLRNRWRCNA